MNQGFSEGFVVWVGRIVKYLSHFGIVEVDVGLLFTWITIFIGAVETSTCCEFTKLHNITGQSASFVREYVLNLT